jgi:ribosomal protein S18 acetylase RimI-like enzyme
MEPMFVELMSEDDLESIARLDALAFSEKDPLTGQNRILPPRTPDNLLASLHLNPSGCFVARTDRSIGYLFSRVWGKLGWIGVFGVDPAYQRQKVGQKLLARGIQSLKEAGCETIGLETRSDKTYNVGLYTRRGFQLTFPTLGMVKMVSPPPGPATYVSSSELEEPEVLLAVSQISEAVQSGLDYAPEARNAQRYRWGETLLFGWPSSWGFAIMRAVPRRKSNVVKMCEIDVLAIHPDHTARLEQALQSVESYALDGCALQVNLSINVVDGDTYKRILDYGFRVDSVSMRMTLDRQLRNPPKGIDLSRWAM